MKRMSAAAAVRVRSAASESNWQEWISRPEVAPDMAPDAHPSPVNGNGRPSHEAIAQLAFALWQERGCPHGSPEQDWLRAERHLLEHHGSQ